MYLEHLEMFKVVAERKNLSRAAEDLHVTQPTVSQAIKGLEGELGVELLERTPRGVELTKAGRRVYEAVSDILERWQGLKTAVSHLLDEPQGLLTLGASTIPGEYVAPFLLSRYRSANARVRLNLRIGDSRLVERWLLDRAVDIGLLGTAPGEERLESFPFARDDLWLVGPGETEIPEEDLSAAALTEMDFVLREEGSGSRDTYLACLENHGVAGDDLKVAATAESNEAAVGSVAAGMGVTFVSRWVASRFLPAVRRLPYRCRHLERKLYCAYRRDRPRTLAAEKLITLFRKHAEEEGLQGPAAAEESAKKDEDE